MAVAGMLIVLTLTAKQAAAQAVVTGTLLGTVQDSSGAVIPGADVTLTNEGTNIVTKTTTGAQGFYTFPNLDPGEYSVAVEAKGFKRVVSAHNLIQVEQTTRRDLTLPLGSITAVVTVTGATPEVESTTSDLGYVITQQQINSLPMSGRMFESLMQLAPGSMPSAWGDFWENPAGGGSVQPGAAGAGMYTEVNGFPFEDNLYLVDGVSDQELMNGFININIPFAEISEMKMETSDPTAQYGTFGASVVNIATKSGTNKFHGSLFDYNRNTDFNASDYFTRINPPFHSNQFGGEIDGPIIKNRLFFSGDLQWLKEAESTSGVWSLPTAAMRSGDLSAFDSTVNGVTSGPITNPMACYYSALANGVADPQPCTASAAITPGSGTADTIPASDIVPIAANFLSPTVTPLPNVPGAIVNNYNYVQPTDESLPQFDIRTDYQLSPDDHLFGRASYAKRTFTQTAPGTVFMGMNDADTYSSQDNDVIGWDHTFSPDIINQFRFGFNHFLISDFVTAYGISENNNLGVPNGNLAVFPDESGIAAMDWSSTWEGVGDPGSVPNGKGRMSDYYQYLDTVSVLRGRHNLMFGGDFIYIHAYLLNPQNDPRGQFKISGDYTGTGSSGAQISDWLVGALSGVWRDQFMDHPETRTNWFGGFAQDDYRITHNTTLNLGLRYDVYTPPYDLNNKQSNFVTSGPGAGLIQLASASNRSPNVNTYYGDLAPRFGIAYTPDGGKTVFHAAFGISYWNDNFGATGGTLERNYPEMLIETNTAPEENCNSLVTPTAASGAPTGYSDSHCGSLILANGLPSTVPTAYGALVEPPVAPGGFIASPAGFGVFQVARNFRQDMGKFWNVAIERQLSRTLAIHVAYVGNAGSRLYHDWQLNQCVPPTYGTAITSLTTLEAQEGVPGNAPAACSLAGMGFQYYSVAPNVSTLDFRNSGGSSHYNSAQAEVLKQFSNGLAFTVSYTWSKQMNNIDNPIDSYAMKQEEDTATSFQYPFFPQVLTATYTYELPYGRGKRFGGSIPPVADLILGGWSLSGVTNFRSGGPLLISAPNGDLGPNGANQRANYLCTAQDNPHTISQWFETNCFTAPVGFTLGDSGIGKVYGPRYQDWDMSLAKSVPIQAWGQLEFQAQFFNIFNHVNLQAPDTGVEDANFGVVSGDILPRQGQLGLTLSF
ncbi:MAG: carboxypeptidase regulatory-like domain-containing protein [Acidobacteriaceae bacterium]